MMVDPPTPGQRRRWIGSGDLFEVRAVEDGHCWIRYDGGSRMSYLAGDIMKLTKVVPVLPPLPEPTWSNVYRTGMSDPRATADLKTICEGSIVEATLIARVPEMVSALRAQAETIDTLTKLVEDAERLIRREVPSGRWPMFWFSNVKRARALTEGKEA